MKKCLKNRKRKIMENVLMLQRFFGRDFFLFFAAKQEINKILNIMNDWKGG